MAGVWSLYRNWRKNGHCHVRHQKIFYLYFLSHARLAGNILFIPGFLDEHKKLYSKFAAQSRKISLIIPAVYR